VASAATARPAHVHSAIAASRSARILANVLRQGPFSRGVTRWSYDRLKDLHGTRDSPLAARQVGKLQVFPIR
jgi:hypothetical protein